MTEYRVTKSALGTAGVPVVQPPDGEWELVGPPVAYQPPSEGPFLYFTWRKVI